MTIRVNWRKGCQFEVVTEQNFKLSVDAESETAPCPTEVLLSALGTCSATDVVLGLQEQGIEIISLRNELSYTLTEESPRLYKSVNLHFVVEGKNITEQQVSASANRAINKYCHVCLMLKPAIDITYSVELKKLAK
jgi:putative redox protein